MFKDSLEGQTYSCQKHIWDSEELNPRCHVCGLLMRDDSLQKESEWEEKWDEEFLGFYSATSSLPEKHKAFISEVRENAYQEGWKMGEKNIVGIYQGKDMKDVVSTAVSNREKEIAEEVEKLSEQNLERLNYKGNRMTVGQTWYQNALRDVLSILKH